MRSGRVPLVRRLGSWLVVGVLLLVVSIAGFIGYARHEARGKLRQLPKLLGADIRSVTDGFTYSQTVKGRTLFTIHASKAIQMQSGKVTLHDVAVTLYGEPGSNRVDSIRGAEFEYDQPNGVVTAMGETQLDLASPASGGSGAVRAGEKRIVVNATGLVFLEKLGVAATNGDVRFQYGAMRGSARGADYDADSGKLELRSAVHLDSLQDGQRSSVDAASALLDRQQRTALLHSAAANEPGGTLRAATMHVDLRPASAEGSGSIEKMRGDGGVDYALAGGTHVHSATLDVSFSTENRPTHADLRGGVSMVGERLTGSSSSGTVLFDRAGQAQRVDLLGSVRLHSVAEASGAARDLSADRLQATLERDESGTPRLHELTATGHAQLVEDAKQSTAAGLRDARTTIRAAVLHATGKPMGGSWLVQHLEGEGGTAVDEVLPGEVHRSSTGDHLTAAFGSGAMLESVVQQGHVLIQEERAAQPAYGSKAARTVGLTRAAAGRAEYMAGTGRLLLTGAPVIHDADLQIAADRIVADRGTGDVEANGAVKGSDLRSSGEAPAASRRDSETLHFLATRATLHRSDGTAMLLGGALPARLWNGTSQVEAPVIDVARGNGTVHAHAAPAAAGAVKAVLADAGAAAGNRPGGPVRVVCSDAVYTAATRTAKATALFTGHVRLVSADGTLATDRATATLVGGGGSPKDAVFSPGAVETVLAEGAVRLQQPSRSAEGARLLYTAAEQKYELTGTPLSLPVVKDTIQGTVTGDTLVFHSGTDSVDVAGASGRPVHTEAILPEGKDPGQRTMSRSSRTHSVPGGKH